MSDALYDGPNRVIIDDNTPETNTLPVSGGKGVDEFLITLTANSVVIDDDSEANVIVFERDVVITSIERQAGSEGASVAQYVITLSSGKTITLRNPASFTFQHLGDATRTAPISAEDFVTAYEDGFAASDASHPDIIGDASDFTGAAAEITGTVTGAQIVNAVYEGDLSTSGGLDVSDDTLLASTTPFTISTQGTYGTVSIDDDGEWVYKLDNGNTDVRALNSGDTLTDTFVVDVNLASGRAETQTVTITISGRTDVFGTNGEDSSLGDASTSDNQAIFGFNSSDTLTGGSGDDLLVGGYGTDDIDLSAGGTDTVVYRINSSDTDGFVKAEDGIDTVMEFTPGEDKLVILDVNRSPTTLAGLFDSLTGTFRLRRHGDDNRSGDLSSTELDAGARAFIDIVFQSGGTVDGGPTSSEAGGHLRIIFDRVTSEVLNGRAVWDTLTGGTNFSSDTISTVAQLSSLFGGFGRPGYDAALDDGGFISIIGPDDLPSTYFEIVPISGDETGSVTEGGAPGDDNTGTLTTSGNTITLVSKETTDSPGMSTGTYGVMRFNVSSGEWVYTLDDRAEALADQQTATETFIFSAGGATFEVTITVTGANDAPVVESGNEIVQQAGRVGQEIEAIDLSGLFTDVDTGDTLTLTVMVLSSDGNTRTALDTLGLEYDSDIKMITGTLLNSVVAGTYVIKIVATDKSGATVEATFVLDILAAIPMIQRSSLTYNPDATSITIDETMLEVTSDNQLDPTLLVYTITTLPDAGMLLKSGTPLNNGDTFTQADINNGLITYVPSVSNPHTSQSNPLSFTFSDGVATLEEQTLEITSREVVGNTVYEGDLSTSGDLDVNDDDLLASTTPFTISTQGTYGTASIDDDGEWVYKLDNGNTDVRALNSGDTLTDTFVVDVNLASGRAETQTVTITIRGRTDVFGTNGGDTSLGDASTSDNQAIFGFNSRDTLTGGSGDDLLVGGYGFDIIDLSAGGTDTVVYRINSSDAGGRLVKAEDGREGVLEFTPGEDKLVILDVNGPPTTLAALFARLTKDAFELRISGDNDGDHNLSSSELDAGARVFLFIVFQTSGTDDGALRSTNAGQHLIIDFDRVTSEALNDRAVWDTLTGGTNFSSDTISTVAQLSSLFGGFGRPGYDAALDDGGFISVIGPDDLPDSYFEIVPISGDETGSVTEGGAPGDDNTGTLTASGNTITLVSKETTDSPGMSTGTYGVMRFNVSSGEWVYTLDDRAEALADQQTATETFIFSAVRETFEVTITVTGANGAPVVESGNEIGEQAGRVGQEIEAIDLSGLFTDVDTGDTFTLTVMVLSSDGSTKSGLDTLGLGYDSGTKMITGTLLNSVAAGPYTIEVIATDGSGDESQPSTFDIVVAPDIAPVIGGAMDGSIAEDVADPLTGTLTITDADGDPLPTVALTNGTGQYGTLTFVASAEGGVWTYELNNTNAAVQALGDGEVLTETFTFTANGAAPITVTITITGANDAPMVSGEFFTRVVATGGQFILTNLSDQFTDVDQGDELTFEVTLDDGAALSTIGLTYNSDEDEITGSVTETGTYVIKIVATDKSGATVEATFDLNIFSAIPIIQRNSLTYNSDATSITIDETMLEVTSDNQLDPTLLVYTITTLPDAGMLLKSGTPLNNGDTFTQADINNGLITYVPDVGSFFISQSNPLSFTISDGVATLEEQTLEITSREIAGNTVYEGDPSTSGDLDVNDDTLLASTTPFTISTQGTYGTASIDDDGEWVYKLDNGNTDVRALNSGDTLTDTLTDTFVVNVTADDDSAQTQTITITISGRTDVFGTNGDDSNLGDASTSDNQAIFGFNSSDTLTGGLGDDLLVGGYGADIIDLSAGGTDTVVYRVDTSDTDGKVKAEDGFGVVREFTPGEDKLVILDVNGSPTTLASLFDSLTKDAFQLSIDGDDDDDDYLSSSELDAGARVFLFINFDAGGTDDGVSTSNDAGSTLYIYFDRVTSEALNDRAVWDTLTGGTNFSEETISTVAQLSSLFGGFGRPGYDAALDDGGFISIIGPDDLPSTYFEIVPISGDETGSVTEGGAPGDDNTGTLTASGNTITLVSKETTDSPGMSTGTYGVMRFNVSSGEWVYTLDDRAEALADQQTATETFIFSAVRETFEVTITVTGANDAPVVESGNEIGEQAGRVGQEIEAIDLSGLFTDVDTGDTFTLTVMVLSSDGSTKSGLDTLGLGYDSGTKMITGTLLNSVAAGPYTIEVIATDGGGDESQPSTFDIVVAPDNAPVIGGAMDGTIAEDVADPLTGTLTITDAEGDPLPTVMLSDGAGQYGTLTFVASADGGVWTYTLNNTNAAVQALKGDTLTDDFTFTAEGADPITVTITISGVNDAPVVESGNEIVGQFGRVGQEITAIDLSSLFTDVDTGDILTLTVMVQDGSARVGLDTRLGLTYDPSENAITGTIRSDVSAGTYTIEVIATDGGGGGAASQPSTFDIVVAPDNAPVIGGAVDGTIDEDAVDSTGTLTITDADNDALPTVVLTDGAGQYGTLTFVARADGGVWTYTLNNTNAAVQALKGNTLTDDFTFTAAGTEDVMVTITISGVNDAPVVESGNEIAEQTGRVGQEITAIDLSGLFTDVDTGDTFTLTVMVLSSDGSTKSGLDTLGLEYDSDTKMITGTLLNSVVAGPYTIEVIATDGGGSGAASQPSTFDIVVAADNAPVIGGAVDGTIAEDGADSITGTLTITDAEDDALPTVELSSGTGQYGTLTFVASADGGVWTYTLDNTNAAVQALKDDTLTDEFTFTAEGAEDIMVTITISGVNDVPVVESGNEIGEQAGRVGQEITAIDLSSLFTDVDTDDTFTLTVMVLSSDGSTKSGLDTLGLEYDSDTKMITGTLLNSIVAGPYTIEVIATDGGGGGDESQPSTFNIVVAPDNAPVIGGAVDGTIAEDVADPLTGTLTITDAEGDALPMVVLTDGAGQYGTLTFVADANGGVWTYTLDNANPAVQALKGDTLTDNFTFTAEGADPIMVTITISGVNDAPVVESGNEIGEQAGRVGQEITAIDLSSLFTDVDTDDTFTLAVMVLSSDGSKSGLDAIGLEYDSDTKMITGALLDSIPTGPYTIEVIATDDGGSGAASQPSTFDIVVAADNAPVIGGAMDGSITEDAADSITGTLIITDADDDGLPTVALSDGAGQYGTLTFVASAEGGVWTYTLNNTNADVQALKDDTLTDDFTFTAEGADPITVTITISGVNDAPTVSGEFFNREVTTGGQFTLSNLSDQFTDVDEGDELTFEVTLDDDRPLSTIGLTYNSDDDEITGTLTRTGTYVIKIVATDKSGATVEATFTITVQATPEIQRNSLTYNPDETSITIDETMLKVASGNESDPTLLVYTITTLPDAGMLLRSGTPLNNGDTFTQADINNGLITYVPNVSSFSTSQSNPLSFTISDGVVSLEEQTIEITSREVVGNTASAQDNTVDFSDVDVPQKIEAGDGSDIITGGQKDDQIDGGAGDDEIKLTRTTVNNAEEDAGADEVLYAFDYDGVGIDGGDEIVGFKRGQDKLTFVIERNFDSLTAFLESLNGADGEDLTADDAFVVTMQWGTDTNGEFYFDSVSLHFKDASAFGGGRVSSPLVQITFDERLDFDDLVEILGGEDKVADNLDFTHAAFKNLDEVLPRLFGEGSIGFKGGAPSGTNGASERASEEPLDPPIYETLSEQHDDDLQPTSLELGGGETDII